MDRNSKLTAINRKKLSAPTTTLSELLRHRHYFGNMVRQTSHWSGGSGSILHHGCGRSVKDSKFFKSICDKYAEFDPTYAPDRSVLNDKYDTVVSNFVLNVLEPEERQDAWMDIMMCVNDGGIALITVRSDKDTSIKGKPHEDGVLTSKGTFQKGYSLEAFEREAEGFFCNVSITSHGHYRTAVCYGAK